MTKKVRKYSAVVTDIYGNTSVFKNIEAYNKGIAKIKVKLHLQRNGVEMFVKSIEIKESK